MFNNKHIKRFSALFLSVLVLHISIVTFSMTWDCDCDKHPERMMCCCNCPKCVDERGGLLSYCHLRPTSNPKEKNKGPSLGSSKCMCGLGSVTLHSPGDLPFLIAQDSEHPSLFPPTGFLKIEHQFLELNDVFLQDDNPG